MEDCSDTRIQLAMLKKQKVRPLSQDLLNNWKKSIAEAKKERAERRAKREQRRAARKAAKQQTALPTDTVAPLPTDTVPPAVE